MFLDSLKKMAVSAIAVTCLVPLSNLSAQEDHFIGEDQPVKRVIQLQPQTGSKLVEADKITASRINRDNLPVPQEPSTAPNVGFEEIDVPKILEAKPKTLEPQENSFQPLTPATVNVTPVKTIQTTPLAPLPQPTLTQKPTTTPPSTQLVPATKLLTPAIPTGYGKPVFATPARFEKAEKTNQLSLNSESQIKTTIQSPRFVNVNKPVEIAIILANTGSKASENIICEATLPKHAKVVALSPQPMDVQGQTVKFAMDRISSKDSRKIVMQLIPTSPQPINVGTTIRTENRQQLSVSVREPKLSVVVNGPRQANLGQKVIHEVIVSNLGDGIASGVELHTQFPPSLVNLKSTSNGAIPSIAPGKSIKIKYESQAIVAGPVLIKSSAQSDDGAKPQLGSLEMKVFEPKLNISAIGPKINFVDRNGIYTIRLENPGQVDITNIDVALAVPMGMNVTTISREANVDASKGVLRWKYDKIPAGTTEQIQMVAVVTEPGAQVCQIAVGSDETANKEIRLQTMVTTRANVSVQIKNDSGPVQVGGRATFTVDVANRGNRKATDINVRVELPESLKPIAMEGQQFEIDGNDVVFNESVIMPGKNSSFRFAAIGQSSGEHLVRSVTQVDDSERKTIAEDTVFVYEVDEARVSESLTPEIPRRK